MTDRDSPFDDTDIDDLYGTLAPGQFYRRDGARLTGETDPSLLKAAEHPDELHEVYHTFDKAHVVTLADAGLLPDGVAQSLIRGLEEMEDDDHIQYRRESGYGCHAGEAYLIETTGEEIGGWLHVGRSTRDLREVGKRVVAREKLLSLIESCLDLCETYADRAEEYADAVVPTYTRFQHAQVATVGFHLLGLERPLQRDIRRSWGAYSRLNKSPAGTAAGTGTDFPIERELTAALLGFEGVADNATDVDKSSDVHLEGSFVPVILLHDVATAAELFLLWSSEEYGLVDIPDDLCGTSSIMPQKKNPLGLVVIKNNVNSAIGSAVSQLVASRSLGDAASVSLSALDAAIDSAEMFETILSRVAFDRDAAETLVYEDWALATDLASLLVQDARLPWRSAHQITAVLCRESLDAGRAITELRPDDIATVAEAYLGRRISIEADDLDRVLDAHRAVEARADVTGSPAPARVREQIETTESFVTEQRDRLAAERQRLDAASRSLAERVRALRTNGN